MSKRFTSVNPATGEVLAAYQAPSRHEAVAVIERMERAFASWRATLHDERAGLLRSLGALLRAEAHELAALAAREMGKLVAEAEAEVRKCARLCDYYAANAAAMLADEPVDMDAGRALVVYEPQGVLLGIMPWNFPFWQSLRFAVPALAAGNAVLLKPALNVPAASLALARLFVRAGFPEDVCQTLFVMDRDVEAVIGHTAVRGVSLTGGAAAGRAVAAIAGSHLKKTVLELGGSDPLIVLEDADMAACLDVAVASRMRVCGQTCIAAKRFIVIQSRREEFIEGYRERLACYVPGDPLDPATTYGPMARKDLLETLHAQVQACLDAGARLLAGGRTIERPGFYYEPSLLSDVKKGMPAYDEELFGPVGAVLSARDEEHALFLANDTDYGLGASIWTRDVARGLDLARRLDVGTVTINALTKSDPRLPFGGVKNSGHGRELSRHGLLECVNIKTVRVA